MKENKFSISEVNVLLEWFTNHSDLVFRDAILINKILVDNENTQSLANKTTDDNYQFITIFLYKNKENIETLTDYINKVETNNKRLFTEDEIREITNFIDRNGIKDVNRLISMIEEQPSLFDTPTKTRGKIFIALNKNTFKCLLDSVNTDQDYTGDINIITAQKINKLIIEANI